jgi:drug/metabolite transporter (DMT)-like permease
VGGHFCSLGWPVWLIVVNGAVGMTAFITSLKLTSVADVSIIYATLPFVTAGLGWLWVRERVAPTTILASAVAAAGVVVMVSGTTLSGHLDGDALALLQTLSMAVAIVAVRLPARRRRPVERPRGAGELAVR